MDENLIDKESQGKIRFLKTQAERAFYLDEYKENVSIALTEEQLNLGVVYPEIFVQLKDPNTAYMKMRRDIPLKYLKPYINEAEKLKVRYMLIDALSLQGDIALVLVVKEPFDIEDREIVLPDMSKKFEEKGLYPEYVKYFGQKICTRHYSMVEEKLPEYREKFRQLTIFDKLIGESCPICKIEKEKNKRW